MKQDGKKDSFERIALKMTSSLDLDAVLTAVTAGLVDGLAAAFARIWLIGPGDLCAECFKAADCSNRNTCLHLKASAGMYKRTNGEYRRVPLGALKIGRIAESGQPLCSNAVLEDERLPNKKWLKAKGLRSFAGHHSSFKMKSWE